VVGASSSRRLYLFINIFFFFFSSSSASKKEVLCVERCNSFFVRRGLFFLPSRSSKVSSDFFFFDRQLNFRQNFRHFSYRGLIFPQNYTEQRDRETELHKDDKVLLGVGILLEDENEALDAGYCRFGVL